MQDFIAMILAFFLLDPLKAALTEELSAANAPAAVVSQVTACASEAAPAIIEHATNDPWWALSSAFRLWTGMAKPDAVFIEAAPACKSAVAAARPYLNGEGA